MKYLWCFFCSVILFITGCSSVTESVKKERKINEINLTEYIQIRLEDPLCAAGCTIGRVPDSGETICFKSTAVLTGADILKASSMNGDYLGYIIAIELNNIGRVKLNMITRENRGKRLGVYVEGRMVTAPVINSVISDGKAAIAGGFTLKEAEEIALKLNSRLK